MTEKTDFIVKRLQDHGFQTYWVGGAVRDMLLQRTSGDIDILTRASIPEIQAVFSDQKVRIVGKSFPVCIINGIEVSSGRAGADAAGFPESDLARRDFTFNAMALDPVSKKIMDPFNGQKDIRDRIIRFTQDPLKRIAEDPVRMVRACRFLALMKGSFSLSTLEALQVSKDLIRETAKERIGREILKAMALDKPSLFFGALQTTGLLSYIFPSLDRCVDLDGGPHHRETVFDHCLLVGDALPARFPVLRLAGFLHDAGKFDAAVLEEDGALSFIGHENHTQAVLKDLMDLRFSVQDREYIMALIKTHMRPLTDATTPKAARRLLALLDGHGLSHRDFMRMRIADKKGNLAKNPYTLSEIRIRLKRLLAEMDRSKAFNINSLDISGHEIAGLLNISPSPEIGRIKALLLERVLDDPLLNRNEELKKLCLSFQIKK